MSQASLKLVCSQDLKNKTKDIFCSGIYKKNKCFGHAILYQKAHIGNISFMNWCLIGEEKSLIL